jgi:hypothetical protein
MNDIRALATYLLVVAQKGAEPRAVHMIHQCQQKEAIELKLGRKLLLQLVDAVNELLCSV